MSEAANELLLIRKYLLGRLAGAEREQLEERVLADAEFRDKVLMVEEDLIEDHAEGVLDEVDRQNFQQMFYANPQRQLDVRVVAGLKKEAATTWWTRLVTSIWKPRETATVGPSSPWGFRKTAIAFGLVLAVVVALFFVYRSLRPEQKPGSLTQEQQRRGLIEQELARVNDPASRESQQRLAVATTLAPGLSRGEETSPAGEFPIIVLTRDAGLVQLTLTLNPSAQEYRRFQAVLNRVGAPGSYRVDLQPVASNGHGTVVLTLPVNVLDDGDYRVQLSGHTADQRTEMLPDHYYYFRLLRR